MDTNPTRNAHEPAVQAFWQNPPWQQAGGYRLGISPLSLDLWCPRQIELGERQRKQELLRTESQTVCAAEPDSLAAQQQVMTWLSSKHSLPQLDSAVDAASTAASVVPLVRCALGVPEDFCIITRAGSEYRLSAACVCAPSYWHLPSKMGLPLSQVHAPVAGLNEKIGPRINEFMQRLPHQRLFGRRNWFIHASHELFQPNADAEHNQATHDIDGDHLRSMVVRSETQTLRRIDDDNILFTILVNCYPLRQLEDYPSAAQAMQESIASFNADEYEEFGLNQLGTALNDYLATIVQI